MRNLYIRILYITAVLIASGTQSSGQETSGYTAEMDHATLARFGVEPTEAGLRNFLQPPPLTADQQAGIGKWLKELGSDRFNTRRLATRDLVNAGPAVLPHVQKLENSSDPEVRLRVAFISNTFKQRGLKRHTAVLAALRTIQRGKISSLTPLLLQLLPEVEQQGEFLAYVQTLLATVQPENSPALLSLVRSQQPTQVRAAAVQLFERAIGAAALPELRKLLDHADEHLRLAALGAIARTQPRECLAALVKLLESEDVDIRARAAMLLRKVTGQNKKFVAYNDQAKRDAAIKSWQEWIDTSSATARLVLASAEIKIRRGRLLLCLFSPFRVAELNQAGKEVFATQQIGAPCGAVGLPDGRRIFADWNAKAVVTLDPAGKVLSKHPVPGTPNCLSHLPNGNTLVGLFTENVVYEMDSAGKFVWKATVKGRPTAVHRLANGVTLVALYGNNRIVEIDRNGKEVWSIEARSPEGAVRLKNGNTLVASGTGRVQEFNRKGDVIWKSKELNSPYDAAELDNGNILIGSRDGLLECDRQNNVIRELKVGTVRRVTPY